MPAPFAKDLCGYRSAHGKPNTSDASDKFSVELGDALFAALGVAPSTKGDDPTGAPLAACVAADLRMRLAANESRVQVRPEQPLSAFEQYRHLASQRSMRPEPSKEYRRAWGALRNFMQRRTTTPPRDVARLSLLISQVEEAVATETQHRQTLIDSLGDESLLKLDVTAAVPDPVTDLPHLKIGLSLKWSLRTDRAQDCRSQGAKLVALRRGPMPHFAAVTMEPRPYMLNLLGGGSGEVDCVYHLDLPALTRAIEDTCRGRKGRQKSLDTFSRLVGQRRLRDYDELVDYAVSL